MKSRRWNSGGGVNEAKFGLFILNLVIVVFVVPMMYLVLWFIAGDKRVVENARPIFVGTSLSLTFTIIWYARKVKLI